MNQTIRQLRSTFPAQVTADTLKKWGIAPNNETYIINVLRFLGVIDDEGKKQPAASKAFVHHDDKDFATAFSELIKGAYHELFDLHGDAAWALDKNKLISFFRATDESSSVVGDRQAQTFQALASFAGYGPKPVEPKAIARTSSPAKTKKKLPKPHVAEQAAAYQSPPPGGATNGNGFPGALTVRVEINLPVTDNQEVYDKIFRSMRQNLLNG